ncbi:MAG: carboxypeptidase regulatory-like domain-containing protein [Acidobacteriota bacterium]|nr:carboxypeptidase regulatory-like domain-containing protein [Acidobacteriota bacterium]
MRSIKFLLHTAAAGLFFAAALAQAAQITGTVTNKTTGKPAAGDTVVLVDVQAGMAEVAHATTDAQGRYSLSEPGSGPYLVRVTHQGAGYFIAAPQGGGTGDIPVYDVAAKVEGVSIEADVIELEADNGQLRVTERFFVHNTSSPPRTEWSPRTFQITLPPEAVVAGVAAQRPTGLPTSVKLEPAGAKGQYAFNFPIQPDEGDKDTLFQIEYTVPYSSSSFTFHPQVALPAQNVGILLPKSMTFKAGSGSNFQSVPEDPNVQTFVAKNVMPGQALEFTVSGTGSIPRQAQGGAQPGDAGGQPQQGTPGGGIGEPINTPDPLSKYKWWILGALALLLAAAAAFLLRKPAGAPVAGAAYEPGPIAAPFPASSAAKNTALLNAMKEELFALESEKLSGKITPEEYAEVKAALETVLKRALKKNS